MHKSVGPWNESACRTLYELHTIRIRMYLPGSQSQERSTKRVSRGFVNHWHDCLLNVVSDCYRYIEAIESRLHRMEALLGGLLQNDDPRAAQLLGELIGTYKTASLLM